MARVPSELKELLARFMTVSSSEVTDSGSNGASAVKSKRPPFPSCLPLRAPRLSIALYPSLAALPRLFPFCLNTIRYFGSPSTAGGGGKTRRGRPCSARELGDGSHTPARTCAARHNQAESWPANDNLGSSGASP